MGLARRKSARTDLVEFIEERGEDGVEPLGPVVVVLVDAPAGGTVEPAEKRRLGLEFQGWARAHPPPLVENACSSAWGYLQMFASWLDLQTFKAPRLC